MRSWRLRGMRTALRTLVVLLAAFAGLACINDRDTLIDELSQQPDIVWAIVGKFNRNPPKYYEMRIQRIKRELKANPLDANAYDDIAAAYDRLHDDTAALEWIRAKKEILRQGAYTEQSRPMDWYRTYANEGSFLAHRFLREKGRDPRELEKGRALIAKALVLNPTAHFGREGTQLAVMDWLILKAKDPKQTIKLGAFLADHTRDGFDHQLSRDQIASALQGIVRLGGAWENPNIFGAIADLTYSPGQNRIAGLAAARVAELAGGVAQIDRYSDLGRAAYTETSADGQFQEYRAAAEGWHRHRLDFMERRMAEGRHPDTDPDFWQGYVELKMPVPIGTRIPYVPSLWSVYIVGSGILSILILAIYFGYRRAKYF